MTDIVSYKLPLGFIGRWFGGWMVRKQLPDNSKKILICYTNLAGLDAE
jgi:hypothetical protein